jgi:cytochrome c556
MSPKIFVLSLAIVAVAGLAWAQAQIAPPPPERFVQMRQASLDMSLWTRGQMEAAMKAGAEAKTQAYPARALAKWAHVLPSMFPTGSGPADAPGTQALPPVWADRVGFLKYAADYAAAADRLSALAQANDTEGFKAQLVTVHQACDACHAVNKGGMQGSPAKG